MNLKKSNRKEFEEAVLEIRKNLKSSRNGYYFIWSIAILFIVSCWIFVYFKNHETSFEIGALIFLIIFCSVLFITPILFTLRYYHRAYINSADQLKRIELYLQNNKKDFDLKYIVFGAGDSLKRYFICEEFIFNYYKNRLEVIFIEADKIKSIKIQESPSEWNKQFFVNVIHSVGDKDIDSYLFLPEVGTISPYKDEVAEIINLLKSKTRNIEEIKLPYGKMLPPRK